MNEIFIGLGVLAGFFGYLAIIVLRLRVKVRVRIAIATVLLLPPALYIYGIGWLLEERFSTPTREMVLTRLQAAAQGTDKFQVEESLRKEGFAPSSNQVEGNDFYESGISWSMTSRARSYISTRNIQVRTSELLDFDEYFRPVFLFDDQDRLLTWSYYIYSPSL